MDYLLSYGIVSFSLEELLKRFKVSFDICFTTMYSDYFGEYNSYRGERVADRIGIYSVKGIYYENLIETDKKLLENYDYLIKVSITSGNFLDKKIKYEKFKSSLDKWEGIDLSDKL